MILPCDASHFHGSCRVNLQRRTTIKRPGGIAPSGGRHPSDGLRIAGQCFTRLATPIFIHRPSGGGVET